MRATTLALAAAVLALPAAARADGLRGFLSVSPTFQAIQDPGVGGRYTAAGATLDPAYPDVRYRDPAWAGTSGPWYEALRLGIALPTAERVEDPGWSLQVAPSVDYLRESGAYGSEGAYYGAVVSAARQFATRQRIGLGVGIYDGLQETRLYPFLLVDWEFNDQWRLTNPVATGPAGPAGLELRYRFDNQWELGAGGAWRSYRYRLDDAGLAAGSVGEERGIAAFLHLARDFGPRYSVDIYAGALLEGELRLENSAGTELLRTKFDPAPLMGITFTGRF